MKVLMINHFPLAGSGSGVYTSTIAKYLQSVGHEVDIIMPEITETFERIEGIRYHPVYFNGGEKIEGQLPFNFPCFTTHPKSSNTFRMLDELELKQYIEAFEQAIHAEIESFHPDIIHSGHIWILSALASKYDIPMIMTAHGTDLIGYQESNRYHSYVEEAIEKTKQIVTISKNNDELVKALFPGVNEKSILIENGYDTTVFYPKEFDRAEILSQFGITHHYDHVVLFVGKLTPIKGVDMLIESAKTYQDQNTLTLIVGDGEERQNLEQMSANLEHVKFIGNQKLGDVSKLYNIADVSVVPSRKEAFGFVAVEALACGTPVIGSDQGEMPNFINEKTGILIHTGNTEELTIAIHKVLHKEVSYDKDWIANYAKEKYSLNNSMNQLLEVYQNVIENDKQKRKHAIKK